MKAAAPYLLWAAALLFLSGGSAGARPQSGHGVPRSGFEEIRSQEDTSVPGEESGALRFEPRRERAPTLQAETEDSICTWPLGLPLNDGIILVNYVDHGAGLPVDYMGYPHTYTGHRGTDLTLYNFRSMDHGVPVLAASDGLVSYLADGYFDRNTSASSAPANIVFVIRPSGLETRYYHLRKYSTAVLNGEFVHQGQILGLVGSSGSSTDAHLHFETATGSAVRDPWNGLYNPIPSLWVDQEPYVGTAPLRIFDMGVFTEAMLGGNPSVTPSQLKERISQPVTFGAVEPKLWIWLQLQGQATDVYDLEIRRPDNSLFASVTQPLGQKIRYGWHLMSWSFGSPAAPAPLGLWSIQVFFGGSLIKSLTFDVGEATVFAPRFWPLAGRSFRLDDSTITYRDTLRTSSLGGPVTFTLKDAPRQISLEEDSIVTIRPPLSHWSRNVFFQAIATDGLGLQDTMWYHLVDFSGSVLVGVSEDDATANYSLSASIAPNPLNPGAILTVRMPRSGPLRVTLFDLRGRVVRNVLDEADFARGSRSIRLDGRGNDGKALGSGVYFYRVEGVGELVTGRLVVLK